MKFALICFGNEESYGLLFVGGELLLFDQKIKYFDAEQDKDVVKKIYEWKPDFICFSPMITFSAMAIEISEEIKKKNEKVISIFGGAHPTACPELINEKVVDIVVRGPVRGSIDRILNGEKGVIQTIPTTPDNMPMPAREQYYKDIPRMANRYRKFILALQGCPWNCSYCNSCSGFRIGIFGNKSFKRYFMHRRPVETMIKEVKEIMKLGKTDEIEWDDDDIFCGYDVDNWLIEFSNIWQKEFNLSLYAQTSSHYALKISDKALSKVSKIVHCIGLGIQSGRSSSLKLFNRQWDNEKKMKKAYDRLVSFGYVVNLQAIVGLPIKDPVEDALDTVKCLQRIGTGSICSVYPLQIYPNSIMEKYCKEKNLGLHDLSKKDTNTGMPNIKFTKIELKRLRNICKLATLFVKYGISEEWMRALIDIDFDEKTSKLLSGVRYRECIVDRLPLTGKEVFKDIMKTTNLRY